MLKIKSEGQCRFCKKLFSSNSIRKHLSSCEQRKKEQEIELKQSSIYLLSASKGPFWVYFEAPANATLEDIDEFLRDLWLDCCGHLSQFIIGNKRYISEFNEIEEFEEEESMDVSVEEVLKPSLSFSHEYDFGTTTVLGLSCIEVHQGMLFKKKIQILARNNLPNFVCSTCKKPATEICPQCIWNGNALFCARCAKKHGNKDDHNGEDSFLPVVNSPRMGMCGYTGPDED